jgi:hypothetical protein
MRLPFSTNDYDNPVEGLSKFFEVMWRKVDGWVYLPTNDRRMPPTEGWRQYSFHWPDDRDKIVQHVLASAAQGLDAYYTPALFKSSANATKANVMGTHVLWAEFDGGAFEVWNPVEAPDPPSGTVVPDDPLRPSAGHTEAVGGVYGPEPPVRSLRVYEGGLPEPTLRIQTSFDGYEHLYWGFPELITDVQWIEDKNRAITYSVRSDPSGWDATQILRPPFTLNFKHEKPLPVTVVKARDENYSTFRFGFLKPPIQLVNEKIQEIDETELPSAAWLVAKYKWDKTHFDIFMDSNIPIGKRSTALTRLGYFCAEIGMSDEDMYSILKNADDRWGKYRDRNDRKKRLAEIINYVRNKHPNPISEMTFAGLLDAPLEISKSQAMGLSSFLANEVHIEWAFEGLLERGGFGMLSSLPGVGKTQLSIQLGLAGALGNTFLHWPATKKHKIAFVSLEMSQVGLKVFLSTIAKQYLDSDIVGDLEKNFIVVPIGQPISLDRPEGFKYLETILDEIMPDGIIIDSVGKLTGEELTEKTSKVLNKVYLMLRSKYNAFIWLIHHNRKATDNNKKPVNLSDIYGSVYIAAEMTSALVIHPDKLDKKVLEMIPVKQRLSELRNPFKIERNKNLFYTIVEGSEHKEGDDSVKRGIYGDL